ncbi:MULTISPECIES: siphovirus Gp157 family protein [unclassified Sulfitobacter]|uniref:siphovirus Gp157 family protein n=1 Tax=unclassified Sulfitobacter TaxID=196795 RepID=UPI0007C226CF|nr:MULTISPECIES: siphovirus Gp157 family protein [unclassified Sulfitobacter]KZY05238.1 hypothetical protein A3721_15005 [Sulfitobacter sp. HI0023]KZY25616.1 hypothetical protein A3728_18325 [Sulfitobacter sp. HI0040]KZZ66197.1 hypothetical protein A3764_17590 [Sulfitobacter sp. HI0129]
MNLRADIPLITRVSEELTEMLGDDFDPDTFWDSLDGETDAMDIIGALIQRRVEAQEFALANKAMADRYSERKKVLDARAAGITKALGLILDATGQQKVAHPLATVSRTKPRVTAKVFDETCIPSQLCVTTIKPDMSAIKKQLDAGEDVPGAELVTGDPGLTVRMK